MNKGLCVIATLMLVVACFFLPLSAEADLFGGSDSIVIVKLSAIYNQLKEYYETNMQILQQAKMQSDNLKKMSQLAQDAKQEYEFVSNFSIQRELRKIKDDIEGLTNLDNLDGKNAEQTFRLLKAEIDRRFRFGTPEEKAKAAELKSQLTAIERLDALQKAKLEEAQTVGTSNQNQKDTLNSVASSCALISAVQLAQEQRRLEEEMAKGDRFHNDQKIVDNFDEALGAMK